MPDIINLRILTRKSTLKVGPYAKETVQKLLDLKKHRHLRMIYYTYEAISFQDDILDEIGVIYRIDKPGSDPSLIERTNKIKETAMIRHMKATQPGSPQWKEAMGAISHKNAIKRKNQAMQKSQEYHRQRLTKKDLQMANHGHITIKVIEE